MKQVSRLLGNNCFDNYHTTILTNATKYSRMDQVKFVEDSFLKGYGLTKAEHTPSNFLKAVFHKFYLDHSWKLRPKCGSELLNFNEQSLVLAFRAGKKSIKDWKTFHESRLPCTFRRIGNNTSLS